MIVTAQNKKSPLELFGMDLMGESMSLYFMGINGDCFHEGKDIYWCAWQLYVVISLITARESRNREGKINIHSTLDMRLWDHFPTKKVLFHATFLWVVIMKPHLDRLMKPLRRAGNVSRIRNWWILKRCLVDVCVMLVNQILVFVGFKYSRKWTAESILAHLDLL